MKRWLKFLVSFGVLGLLLVLLPWKEIISVWRDVSIPLWLSIVAGFIAIHFVGVAKWRMILNTNAGGSLLGFFDAYRFYVAGLFANLCLPSIVGGDVLRAALAGKRIGEPEAVVLGGVADRMIDTIALGALIGVGGILAGSVISGWSTQFALILILVGAGLALLLLPFVLRRPLDRWPKKYRRNVGRGLVSIRRLWRNPRVAVIAFVLALSMQTSFVLLNAWLGWSLGIDVPLAVWFLAWPLAKAAGLVPVSIGGLGVRDATLAALLVPFGVPAAQGLVASLVWQTVLIAGGLLGGLSWWLMGRARGAGEESILLTRSAQRSHG